MIKIPLIAPTPVPTMTAVGVARPRAHGQAIDRTDIAHWKEYCHTIWVLVMLWFFWIGNNLKERETLIRSLLVKKKE